MGLLKAGIGAAGGVLADQWREYFYCEALPADVLMTMVGGVVRYEKSQWHVDIEFARDIARVIEIRGKLRG